MGCYGINVQTNSKEQHSAKKFKKYDSLYPHGTVMLKITLDINIMKELLISFLQISR